ncbi:MAG: DNA repair protein RadC [bacterium]|nr:DNA repair protein RadC [bacterium]
MSAKELHYHGHRQRLRERFIKSGLQGLADHEVVELLLTLAIPRVDVKEQAKALLNRYGNLKNILDAPLKELQEQKIGNVAPVALHIIRETASLYLQQSAENRDVFTDPEVLHQFWRAKIGSLPNEVFQVGYLDSGYRLSPDGVETLEEGTVDRANVYPRKVVEAALRRGAAALIFAHNHPNGNVQPSEQDKLLTRALVLAATTVQIKVLDHLIISPDEVFSFRKEGLL